MPPKLLHNHYGKSGIRLTKVTRLAGRHELTEVTVNVSLSGAFAESYTNGDNSNVIATDSIKNTVYVLAKKHALDSPESFGLHLAGHFASTYAQVKHATVEIAQSPWKRIDVGGRLHPTAFAAAGSETRRAVVTAARAGHGPNVHGGLADLLILKTTDSAFAGFVRDGFTTLPEVEDRILATELSADWGFGRAEADYNAAFDVIRRSLLETFALHRSRSVQQTLYDMAAAALAAEPAIHSIHLRMPNKHRVPFNFKPFGLEFDNDIFITTDEPSGEISAHLQRE